MGKSQMVVQFTGEMRLHGKHCEVDEILDGKL